MKLLGIDYGGRRIGVAVTDERGGYIRGLTTIDRRRRDPFEAIENLVRSTNPAKLVFGLPLGPDDEETTRSGEVREFAERVAQRVELPFDFIDESFSSHRAREVLRFRKKKDRRNKANIDRVAACLILEEYRRQFPCELE